MLNRDDKYEGQEDSEYRFTDDEVSYEIETEEPKAAPPSQSGTKSLGRSKRMLISLGVFFVLIFVVYKMVAPSSSTAPSTEITAAPAPTQPVVANAPTVQPQVQTVQPQQAAPSQVVAQPQAPAMQAPMPTEQPTVAMPTQQVAPVATQVTAQPAPTNTMVPATGSATIQPTTPQPTNLTQEQPQMATGTPPIAQQVSGVMDEKIAAISANAQNLINQSQVEYLQKLNDYSTQNKQLQDQMQQLSTRVAGLEAQFGQVIQALTRQNSSVANTGSAGASATSTASVPDLASSEAKANYSVQAIIPGRAWLKSDNGETVTVAEGDVIKDMGRVTKIDPYDGVVEINTGNKIISLSYGNGG